MKLLVAGVGFEGFLKRTPKLILTDRKARALCPVLGNEIPAKVCGPNELSGHLILTHKLSALQIIAVCTGINIMLPLFC